MLTLLKLSRWLVIGAAFYVVYVLGVAVHLMWLSLAAR